MCYTYNDRRKRDARRLPRMLFILLLIMLIPTTVLRAQRLNRSNYQLLWRIDGPGISSPSYLFGTMHLTDKRVFEFSDSVLVALRNANSFAMEVDMDSLMSYIFSPGGIMSDTTNYMRRILTTEEYDYVDSLVIQKTGSPIDRLQMKRLWIIETLLLDQEEALSKKAGRNSKGENIFLDGWLHQKASLLGKPVHSLERMQNQLHLVGTDVSKIQKEAFLRDLGYYEAKQADMKNVTANFDERISLLDSFVDLYYQADLQSIATLIKGRDSIDEGPGLRVRNIEMANNLAVLVNKGSVFAAVGAAHLPGEKGIISLLRSKGFTVTAVKATFTGLAKKDRQQLDSVQGYTLNKIAEGYSVVLPGVSVSYPIPNTNRKMYIGNNDAHTGFAFCMDLPQMGMEDQQLANTMIANMARQGNATLQKSYPITYRGIAGMEATMLQKDLPFHLRVFIRNHRVFVFMYGTHDKDSTARIAFFKSVRFYDIVRPAVTYDTLYRPQLGFSAIVPSDVYHVNNTTITRPVEAYSGIDDVNGISYVLRIDKMKAGYFNEDDQALLAGIRMTLLKEDSTLQLIDSSLSERDGLPLYQLRFRHTSGYISRLHFIPRGNLAYTLLSVYDGARTDSLYWQRFMNGFHVLPLQAKAPGLRFTPADSSFSVMGPGTFEPFMTGKQDESSPVKTYSYVSVDTMSYATYTAEVFKYNRYYYEEPDSIAKSLTNPVDSSFTITSQQKTMLQGQAVYTTELKMRHTGLRSYRKTMIAGHTVYHLSVTVPEELASKGYGQQFLASFQPGTRDKADTSRLQQKKLAMLLKDLQSSDTTVFNKANRYLHNITPDSTDKELLLNALTKSFPADTVDKDVKLRLLSLLAYIPDNDAVAAAERLFSATNDTLQRIKILRFLTGLSLDSAMHTFLRLAPAIPEGEMNYLDIFPYEFKEDSLYQRFLPEMIATAERSRSFLQAFVSYTDRDSMWHPQQLAQHGLDRLLPAVNQLFEYQVQERAKYKDGDLWVWSSRLLSTGRILTQPGIPPVVNTILAYKQLLTDTIISLEALGVQGLMSHGIRLEDKRLRRILADPEIGYEFLTTMEDNKQLPQIRHLLSQESIGRSYLAYYYSEDYDVSTIEQVTRVKVQHEKEPAQWLTLYRLKSGDSEDWEYILNGPQPLNSKELNINPMLIHTITDKSKWKDKKQLTEEAAEAYESFLKPEESDEDY